MQGYTGQGTLWEQGEGHVSIFPRCYDYITKGRWRSVNSAGYPSYTTFTNDQTHAVNDEVAYRAWLSPGTYTFCEYIATGPDHGIITVYMDGVSLGTIDHYSGGNVYGVQKVIANVVITTPGLHVLSLKVTGKTGSNYYIYIFGLALWRTA
jgi:hypothetical protein